MTRHKFQKHLTAETFLQVTHERFSSELVLPRARSDDSGNYTCVPSNAQAASISVHVIKSEYQYSRGEMVFG